MGGRGRRETEFAGRPKSDANYGQKKRFNNDNKREGGNRHNDRGPKEVQLFKATCTTCSKPCEVPFRPNGEKPVLCRDCFATKNSSPAGNDNFSKQGRDNGSPHREQRPSSFRSPAAVDNSEMLRKIAALEIKVNEILDLLTQPKTEPEKPEAPKAVKTTKKAKVVKPKKTVKKATKKGTKKK